MKINNESIRRQDRLLAEPEALDLLRRGEYGVLSICSEEGRPYSIPINYVWNEEASIYLHCAPEGRKLRCIQHNPEVCFTVVGRTHLLPDKFTTEYESIVLEATASQVPSPEERMQAITLLLDKYAPDDKPLGLKYTEKSLPRTVILRLDIHTLSGKAKRVKQPLATESSTPGSSH